MESKIKAVKQRISKLLDLFTAGEFDKDELLSKRAEYENRIRALEGQRKSLHQDDRQVFEKILAAIDFLTEAPRRFLREKTPTKKAAALKAMANSLYLVPDGRLRIQWMTPFSILLRPEVLEAIAWEEPEALSGSKNADSKAFRGAGSSVSRCVPGAGIEPARPKAPGF